MKKMSKNIIDFLLENADIAIRYRVKRDLCEYIGENELNKLRKELECSPKVIHLLECLKIHKEYHGATLFAVENSLNMLIDMGLQYGIGSHEFDAIVKSIADEAKNRTIDENHVLGSLSHIVVVPALLRVGY